MTTWGIVPARGRLRFCGVCGDVVAFAEERRPGCVVQAETNQVALAIEAHFGEFPECRAGTTFQSGEIVACRCDRPMRLPREQGLYCARCDGLISPHVAGPTRRSSRKRGEK